MLEPVSVGLKFGFLAVLYLFLMWVAWSALRDLRRGRGSASIRARRPRQYDDATGMYAAAAGPRPSPIDGFEPRLLVERAAGHESGTRLRPVGRRYARPRRRRDPARGSVRVLAPRPDRASGTRGRDRGSRLHQRHLSERGAAERPAAAAPRRPDPDRRLRVLLPAMTRAH